MSSNEPILERGSAPLRAPDRSVGIDMMRGLLTILVVGGHYLELTQGDSLFTWLGSGFRMPLFIGLSGYLFNVEASRKEPIGPLSYKYYRRMILPWAVACVVDSVLNENLSPLTPVYAVIRPPFHLWFVPVLVCFVFVSRASGLGRGMLLAWAIPISIAAMYLFGVGHEVHQPGAFMPDRRFFIFPIYFAMGMWIAHHPSAMFSRGVAVSLGFIGLVWWISLFHHASVPAEVAAELILCIPLISMIPTLRDISFNLPLITNIGRDSMFFYLWHPLVLGIWLAIGFQGGVMLACSLLSLLILWRLLVLMPTLGGLLGVLPRRRGKALEASPPHRAVASPVNEPVL